jgi:hypothetical protein
MLTLVSSINHPVAVDVQEETSAEGRRGRDTPIPGL